MSGHPHDQARELILAYRSGSGGYDEATVVEALDASLAREEAERVGREQAEARLAKIRPLTDAERRAMYAEHDVVHEARRLSKAAGEINSTRDLDRALKRYDEAEARRLSARESGKEPA